MQSGKAVSLPCSTDSLFIFYYRESFKYSWMDFCMFYIADDCTRTPIKHGNEFFQYHGFSGRENLYPAIGKIEDSTGDREIGSNLPYTRPEPDSLNPSGDGNLNGFHRSISCMIRIARPSSSKTSSRSADCLMLVAASIALSRISCADRTHPAA